MSKPSNYQQHLQVGELDAAASTPALSERSTFQSPQDLAGAFRDTLRRGVHGLCFSPYLEGQAPGSQVSDHKPHSAR